MANKRRQGQTSEQNTRSKRLRTGKGVATSEFSMKIVDLIDDCLEHVFNYLALEDLLNVAEANKRLGQNVAIVFARKYKEKTVEIWTHETCSSSENPIKITDDAIRSYSISKSFKIIRLFGASITKVYIFYCRGVKYPSHLSGLMMAHVNEYCSKSLKSLIVHWGPDLKFATTMKPYEKLEELRINGGLIEFEGSQFNSIFPNVRRLELFGARFTDPKLFVAKFPHIEELKIILNNSRMKFGGLELKNVKEIIRLNPQLQCLGVLCDSNVSFLKYINEQLKQLKHLELYYDQSKFRTPVRPIHFKYVETFKYFTAPNYDKTKLEKVIQFDGSVIRKCTQCLLPTKRYDFLAEKLLKSTQTTVPYIFTK